MQRALTSRRADNFPQWYQEVVRAADLAEFASGVRGCMVIKPWGYAIWELIRDDFDRRIKASGHSNCYFPLFIPLSFIAKEAEHAEGFAKEMAVVTHHRLKAKDGKLIVDPEAELTEPLIIRPTSETIIGDAFSRWIKSHRDLPLLINQWANVVRWEMRPRLFLRTIEFLWQEGHTAHASADEAIAHTMRMLEMYRAVSEDALAVPVIVGEKTEDERFAGAKSTFSIEAMMQDGKALQMGTSHYLATNFAEAQNIRYQNDKGEFVFCHTTSWGVSTRLVGGVIMTHGDDDGLRLPPPIAPHQIVIIPIVRGKPEDEQTRAYCQRLAESLRATSYGGAPVRAHLDLGPAKPQDKRWDWVRRGVPIIVEVGGREASEKNVTFMRRDRVRENEKVKFEVQPLSAFVGAASALLSDIFASMMKEAQARLQDNIRGGVATFDELKAYFGEMSDEEDSTFKGWVRASWCKPTGAELEAIAARLKTLKLTIRNAPSAQPAKFGACLFTGKPGVEEVLISRAY